MQMLDALGVGGLLGFGKRMEAYVSGADVEVVKALEVIIQKVVTLLSAKEVLFYFQLPCRCDPLR